ncbi:hypothetical protein LTR05_000538 [Lithohypha guttulata]|uniref:Uncharacterized protein n=1 Tax=Lithohypha guttulata TaxID=1690604 RepID=A0AAN7T7J6_9EURO|nr:hypothetical protein LTR05_000538 [Lithohypha guttulata]
MDNTRRRSSVPGRVHTSVIEDADALAAMGHKQELQRNFSTISMLGLAFAILNSWTALAASLSLALPSGGPSAVIWGLITAGCFNLCLAASLAEFLSAYPTAGGQYHWAAMISPKDWSRGVSWVTGWVNVSGWIALTATGGLLGSQLILGVISFYHESFEPQRWQQFLIYIAYTLIAFLVNTYLTRLLPLITQAAFIWSLLGFVVISIAVLACASPNYQRASFVYSDFINTTGWPDGLAWLLGLLQGALALTGFDSVAHLCEEIPEPHLKAPKILIYCILIGMFTGWVFLSCLLFVLTDIDSVVTSTAGPLLEIFYQATGNRAGSVCLLIFPLVCLVFATIGIMSTSSRMTYAFARDRGLPFSRFFAKVHVGLDTPVNALVLTTVLVVIFGCIFLGSTAAFNAIVAASVVALGVSYAIPPAINILRGRRMLPETRAFKLPNWLGWFCNIVGVLYSILTTILFVFPPAIPVTGNSMNYAIVAFAVVILISVIQWVVDGRKNYKGPQIDVGAMINGEVEGLNVIPTNESSGTGVGKEKK